MTPVGWVLVFVPALVALYFLKLKRRDVAISSTYLWKRCVEDLHVNSLFQRLRRSLLFFLQLAALCLLILAVWQPRCDTVAEGGRNLIVLIDQSASLRAKESGGTRLERARELALELVDGLRPGDRMQVIAFASQARTVQPLSADKGLLEARIRGIEATSLPTDLRQALLVVNSMAATLDAVEVTVIGDGCYGEASELPPEVKRLNLRFVNVGTKLDNVGITEADVRRSFGRDKITEVFALVESFSGSERTVTVSLLRGESVQRVREVTLAPGASEAVLFDISDVEIPQGESRVLRLDLDADDGLDDDDRAFVAVPAPKTVSVLLVGNGNLFVENAIQQLPNVRMERVTAEQYEALAADGESERKSEQKAWDVVVFDRVAPQSPPAGPALFIGCKPPLPAGVHEPEMVDNPAFLDLDQGHPVNRFLSFVNIRMAKSWVFRPSPAFHALVESEQGAVVGAFTYREAGRYPARAVVVGFDILASNWPINHHSFPIFFANAVSWLGEVEDAGNLRWRTGESLVHRLPARTAGEEGVGLSFRRPSGNEEAAVVEKSGAAVHSCAQEIGVYELRLAGERIAEFPVSLLDRRESDLTPSPEIDVGDFTIAADTRLEGSASPGWRWLALAAFVVLVLEWYVYNRRVYL
jgi:hypothetical protein